MKDWFYASNGEIVSAASGTKKSAVVKSIRNGNKSVELLEKDLGITVASNEVEDVNYLIKIYSPMSYDNLSGCSGCGGCVSEKNNC